MRRYLVTSANATTKRKKKTNERKGGISDMMHGLLIKHKLKNENKRPAETITETIPK